MEPALNIRYRNPREAALQVRTVIKQPGNQFTARPYNPYEADTSDWWVVPSTDWPAFHHGKFGFSSHRTLEPGHLLVGVNVEKGFSPRAVHELGKPHTWAINSTWVWPEFLGALRASELGAGTSDLKRLSGVDPWMHVEASYAEDRPIDPGEGTPRADLLDFTISAGSLRLIRHDALHGLLSDASRSDTLLELGNSLAAIRDSEWVWLDLWIGVIFKVHTTPEAWDGVSLVDRGLSPWWRWFR